MLKEFKEFAIKGNMLDLAVGIIIGAAFNGVVKSLVDDIVMPPIGVLLGRVDFSLLQIPLTPDAAIRYGLFINTIINFLIVALVVFFIVRWANRMKRRGQAAEEVPNTKNCPYCISNIPITATRCPSCTSQL